MKDDAVLVVGVGISRCHRKANDGRNFEADLRIEPIRAGNEIERPVVLSQIGQAPDCKLARWSIDGKLQVDLKVLDGPVQADRDEYDVGKAAVFVVSGPAEILELRVCRIDFGACPCVDEDAVRNGSKVWARTELVLIGDIRVICLSPLIQRFV